ncbi:MAG: hypothetical protein J0H53_20120 [Rhizobiales bacterium]|jgi:hypothetical protein|nr:hypothetical protein [Hyphomicrobiales bacterium]OJU35713.1 MAG: hypothetical protein BGN94_23325 [Rhizobiales bacterium 68-8]
MNTDPRWRDPLDPRDPAADPRVGYTDPRVANRVEVREGGSRAGLALAAIVAALLVIGFIAFSGGPGVDDTPTASTGQQNVIVPGDGASAPQPATPAPAEPQQAAPSAQPQQQAPAAAPQDNAAPAANE